VIGFLPSTSYAGPTFYAKWSVSDDVFLSRLESQGAAAFLIFKIIEVRLDLTLGNRYLGVHGVYETKEGDYTYIQAVTGTGYFVTDEVLELDLSHGASSRSLIRLNISTLNGAIRTFEGMPVSEGTVTLKSLE
jgi:hypothetical protein